MAFNPTPMQEKAIKESGNILVSAAAGSGKTAVLVERVIYLIKEKGINIDKLLIVTFTNAAAAEMRSRIEKRIHEEIQATDEEVEKRVEEMATAQGKPAPDVKKNMQARQLDYIKNEIVIKKFFDFLKNSNTIE